MKATPEHTPTITRLVVNNFMKVRSIDITPDATGVIELRGANAQGKSSVLRAMWAAFGGKSASPSDPVRHGEKGATSRVELGDMIVERTWLPDGRSKLEVFNASGATYRRPQDILNHLVSQVAFDPVEFMRMTPKQQAMVLRDVAGVDSTQAEQDVEHAYQNRRDQNAIVKRLEANLGERPEGVAPVDIHGLTEELETVRATHRKLSEAQSSAAQARGAIARHAERIEATRRELFEVQSRLAQEESQMEVADKELAVLDSIVTAAEAAIEELTRPEDVVCQEMELAVQQGVMLEKCEQWNRRFNELQRERSAAERMDDELSHYRQILSDLVSAAEYPVDGLRVTQHGVFFNDVLLEQASTAEQLQVSMAMAMATNPKLKVVHIKEGSMLDSKARKYVQELAVDRGYQVWVEIVDDEGDTGLVIEDGALKE